MMNNRIYLILACLLPLQLVLAQPASYDVSGIADSIRRQANVVKRAERVLFEVTDIDKASYSVHRVLTVLKKEGAESLSFVQFTNRYLKIDDVELRLLDPAGNPIARFRKKDLIRQARNTELVEEGEYVFLPVKANSYPVTVDLRYRMVYTGTLFYPRFFIQQENEGVEQASLTVRIPEELGLRYKSQRTGLQPQVTRQGKYQIYEWSANALIPWQREAGSGNSNDICPAIILAPNRFRIYNTLGDMSSWKAFGVWQQKLMEGLDELPEERKQFFAEMVRGLPGREERVKRVYEYLQQHFRYVSIQLGIGGYKPFPAKFTDEKKYGDCKGLSFYMHSVLKTLGIRSHVALVNADREGLPADPAFPLNNFNHMILCVPGEKDSIWLECTSKTAEFNFLGSTTENRTALLITEEGGQLVATPASRSSANSLTLTNHVFLREDGSGDVHSLVRGRGNYKALVEEMATAERKKREEYINHYFQFRQPEAFTVTTHPGGALSGTRVDLRLEKIPQFSSGTKMFLSPSICNLFTYDLPDPADRKEDYFFPAVWQKTDTTVYHLPDGYSIDILPDTIVMQSPQAEYRYSCWFDEEKKQVYSITYLALHRQRLSAAEYGPVKEILVLASATRTQKLVITGN